MRYAQIIVDITSDSVDRLFTYRVPDGLQISPGFRVAVPFGSRTLEGYVIELTDQTDLPPEKLKSVIRTLEDYPALLPEMIELAQWMREAYRVNLCEALRLMIPSELRGERVRGKHIHVAELAIDESMVDGEIAKRARAPRQVALLEALRKGALPTSVLTGGNSGAAAALRALGAQGIVHISAQEELRRPYSGASGVPGAEVNLTGAQRDAVAALTEALSEGGGRFLMLGVTGSGKTETYIHLIKRVLKQGKTAIVLVPEIALTPQMVDWFRARFGDDAAVLHSRLSPGERFDEWRRVRLGKASVVIGARSAVFAPLERLGAIIVDEEHEHTYQSDKRPRYDAREVAWERCARAGAVLLLASATPSIATFMRTLPGVRPRNKLTLLELSERVMGRPLPVVEIVDMRTELSNGNHSIFSAALQAELSECFDRGRQAILFINRRGHSTFVSCRACGYVEKCNDCDVTLTYHQSDDLLRCHYCGALRSPPVKCPACGSPHIKYFGIGTQRVEAELLKLHPGIKVLRMDVDTTRGKDSHEKILGAFRRGEARALIGTQMIAKGLDFPNVTLVGVIAADVSLNVPDFRSEERTFQLLTQVAGRAGRAEHPGKVIVQSYDPEHFAIQLAAKQDYKAFYHKEAQRRRRGLYPPYTLIARILFSSVVEASAKEAALAVEKELNAYLDEGHREDVVQMRALEAPLKRIRGESRWQVFAKLYARGAGGAVVERMEQLAVRGGYPDVKLELEVNPTSLL